MKSIDKSFKEEDNIFINACMRHGGDCNGCKYENLCEELLSPKKEVKDDKISNTKKTKSTGKQSR